MQRQKFNVKMQRQNTTRKKKMQRNKCNEKCNVKNAMKMQWQKCKKKKKCNVKNTSHNLKHCENANGIWFPALTRSHNQQKVCQSWTAYVVHIVNKN